MGRIKALLVVVLCWPILALAQWDLKAVDSTFQYATVKNGAVYEVNSFDQIKGYIGSHGIATLTVDLASVNTGIAIRDTRMKKMLFNLAGFPEARIKMPVDIVQLAALSIGEMWPLSTGGELQLNGHQQTILTELHIYRLSEKRWLVKSAQPVMIDAQAFGLLEGVEALRKIAGLDGIMPQVPVSFDLVFEKL